MKNKFKGVRFTCIDELNFGCKGDPVMKGGHTHNHIFNAVNRHTFRKKKERKKAKDHKYLFYRQQKETLEEAFNHWALFKKIFEV